MAHTEKVIMYESYSMTHSDKQYAKTIFANKLYPFISKINFAVHRALSRAPDVSNIRD